MVNGKSNVIKEKVAFLPINYALKSMTIHNPLAQVHMKIIQLAWKPSLVTVVSHAAPYGWHV